MLLTLSKNYSISLFIENFLIHKSYNKYKRISFSVYYVTVKVNNSHSRLTLSHTIAHAEDRPPPWCFFTVFWGEEFFCLFQNLFYEIEIAAFASIVTKPIFFFDVCTSFQFLNGTLYGCQR